MKGKMLLCAGGGLDIINKSNWPSVATLGFKGWMIKVNGDQ
jgi:hypothetical protein